MGSYIGVGRNRKFLLKEHSNEAFLEEHDGSRVPVDPRRKAFLTHESISVPVGGDARVVIMVAGGDINAALQACEHAGVGVNISSDAAALFDAIQQHRDEVLWGRADEQGKIYQAVKLILEERGEE